MSPRWDGSCAPLRDRQRLKRCLGKPGTKIHDQTRPEKVTECVCVCVCVCACFFLLLLPFHFSPLPPLAVYKIVLYRLAHPHSGAPILKGERASLVIPILKVAHNP